jgi:hypothetical protein
MPKSVEDDVKIMKRIRQAERTRRWVLVVLAVVFMFVGVALGLFLGLNKARLSSPQIAWIVGGFLVLTGAISGGTILFLRRLGPDFQALRDPFAVGYPEVAQAQRHRFFMLAPVIVLLMLPSALMGCDDIVQGRARLLDFARIGPLLLIGGGILLLVCGVGYKRKARELMDDEFSLSIRRRALQAGFFTVMAAVAALFLASLIRPALAAQGLLVVLALGVAAPAAWFAWFERRAERNG